MTLRFAHKVCAGAAFLLFIASGNTFAEAIQGQAGLRLHTPSVFVADKFELYSVFTLRQRMRAIRTAALESAIADGLNFPNLASELFSSGLVDDPIDFYNSGDADPAPTTIDNDVSNAINSAQISFDYFGADLTLDDPSSAILFADNDVNNNAGLGKYTALRGTSIIGFQPAIPRVFSQIPMILTPSSTTQIRRHGDAFGTPFAFEFPNDATVESFAGPHQFDLVAEGSITQEFLDVFAAEGFDDNSSVSYTANGQIIMPNTTISGPPSATVPVSAYMMMDAIIRAPTGSENDLLVVAAVISARDNASGLFQQSFGSLGGNQDFGFSSTLALPIISRNIIQPGDPRHIVGLTSIELRLIASFTVILDTSAEYSLQILGSAARIARVDSNSTPGDFASISTEFLHPITPNGTQVKLYVPPGYSFVMGGSIGPTDLILPALKGDIDLDGVIGPIDQAALTSEYTRPLAGSNYTPASFDALSTFDFDGDGDIDCSDHQSLVDAWNAGGSPSVFANCDFDSDLDGIPNGDDECANTSSGIQVTEIGCPKGDFNLDGVVDESDLEGLVDCAEGALRIPNPSLSVSIAFCNNAFDFDNDNNIDLADFASLQQLIP